MTGIINLQPPITDTGSELEEINSSEFYGWPDILLGTENGEIYSISQNSRPRKLGEVEHDIMSIEASGNSIYVTSTRDQVQSEESENYGSRLKAFTDQDTETRSFDGPIHDLSVYNEKIYITSKSAEGDAQRGKIHILDSTSLETIKEINLDEAYGIEISGNKLVGFGEDGAALTMDLDSDNVENRFKAGDWIGNVDIRDDRIYFASRREVNETITEDLINTVSHGYISEHEINGDENFNIDLGITSSPHEINKFSDDEMIVSSATGDIKFINLSEREVMKEIETNDDLTKMIISGNKAYIVGKDKEKVYIVDLSRRVIEREVDIPGVNSISQAGGLEFQNFQ